MLPINELGRPAVVRSRATDCHKTRGVRENDDARGESRDADVFKVS
jgi:hypothetical protein